ncbi:hypothetical protein GWI33_000304 [Rhynchophorus ferrugineus]|uniref:Uncharacterized protein n=1 Tax=Rhynchophorus ferrugineus TaxID=354439 RepID=A0A834HR79_RHYFE|nr:hypothetical protein GWI33_000304 [Rhynchophorus ferrugineus]
MFKNVIRTLNSLGGVRPFSQKVARPLRQKKPKADGNSMYGNFGLSVELEEMDVYHFCVYGVMNTLDQMVVMVGMADIK